MSTDSKQERDATSHQSPAFSQQPQLLPSQLAVLVPPGHPLTRCGQFPVQIPACSPETWSSSHSLPGAQLRLRLGLGSLDQVGPHWGCGHWATWATCSSIGLLWRGGTKGIDPRSVALHVHLHVSARGRPRWGSHGHLYGSHAHAPISTPASTPMRNHTLMCMFEKKTRTHGTTIKMEHSSAGREKMLSTKTTKKANAAP